MSSIKTANSIEWYEINTFPARLDAQIYFAGHKTGTLMRHDTEPDAGQNLETVLSAMGLKYTAQKNVFFWHVRKENLHKYHLFVNPSLRM